MEETIRIKLAQLAYDRGISQDEDPHDVSDGKNGKEDPHRVYFIRHGGSATCLNLKMHRFDIEFIYLYGDRFF
jgi:hypothetical protein